MTNLPPSTSGASGVRLAEMLAALSIATDYGMGQPLEFALQACVLAMRLADRLALPAADQRAVFYQALLRYVGCNAETRLLAAIFGDELALRADLIHLDPHSSDYVATLLRFIRQANAGANPLALVTALATGMARAQRQVPDLFAGHCEVAGRLAERLGLGPAIAQAIRQVYARWDGQGTPPLKGEAIAPSALIVSLAQDAVAYFRLNGLEAAVAMARQRRGGMYAPAHVDVFVAHAADLLGSLEGEPAWETVLALEPRPQTVLSEAALTAACEAAADFTDLKSPFLLGHSPGVARLAEAAGRACGLPAAEVTALRRAALLHDLGRVGVSAGIWGKPGPLTARDWEAVRLHAYHTERILSRPTALAQLGALAGLHHERLDGSGYHRGSAAAALSPAARILAAADVYQALTEARPHRAALDPEQAAATLKHEAHLGRLDAEAVSHVLTAAGHHVMPRRKALVAGLSERELEVLRLAARGHSIKAIAAALVIAPKTVDNHLQHIYAKLGVTTRAGATLFALEQNLL